MNTLFPASRKRCPNSSLKCEEEGTRQYSLCKLEVLGMSKQSTSLLSMLAINRHHRRTDKRYIQQYLANLLERATHCVEHVEVNLLGNLAM